MKVLVKALLGAVALSGFALPAYAETTLTIATVNNDNMITMQKLTDDFTKANPDIKLNWVTLEENVLRQKVTTDIATKGGQFDVLTIGTYETPIWAKKGWLVPLDKLGADYDVDDLLPAIRAGLSLRRKALRCAVLRRELLRHVPQGPVREGRPDDAGQADLGLHQARRPTRSPTRPPASTASACAASRAGARTWRSSPRPPTRSARAGSTRSGSRSSTRRNGRRRSTSMSTLMKADGPPGASSNGFNENLALFSDGKCGMWIDATVAAGFVTDPAKSKVADKVGFALAPDNGLGKRGNWLWAWSLAVPAGSNKIDAAEKFISWATSKHYLDLVAAKNGVGRRSAGNADLALQERRLSEGRALRADDDRTRSTRPIRPIRQ